ncbi:MAG: 2-oxoacid:ferredoxin oxidoreductase subunit gamma [Clostridiales bacterium]|nr:2-oxoacid:ferredoxin oxidoreductase subunit gamma [Clostridiales bacterium]
MTNEILIAGFGGQGVLFAGKCLAYEGLEENKQVSWLPSYGPEMRGGTASCGVIISDEPVGSPIVSNPTILIAMNLPSLDKYENATVAGGKIFVDSALISREVVRKDVDAYYIPATRLANELGTPTLANMIILGKMIKETGLVTLESATEAMKHVVSAKRASLLEANIKALQTGYNY